MFMIWVSAHRGAIFAVFGLGVWVLANYWYLRLDIKRWKRDNAPHRWSVDMATGRTEGSKTKASH